MALSDGRQLNLHLFEFNLDQWAMRLLIGPQSARSAQLSDNSFIKINIRVVIGAEINDLGDAVMMEIYIYT